MTRTTFLFLATLFIGTTGVLVGSAHLAAQQTPPAAGWAGAYSADQAQRGAIGFQSEGVPLRWRNIRIKAE
jgi:opacity protein-like surface antigen